MGRKNDVLATNLARGWILGSNKSTCVEYLVTLKKE